MHGKVEVVGCKLGPVPQEGQACLEWGCVTNNDPNNSDSSKIDIYLSYVTTQEAAIQFSSSVVSDSHVLFSLLLSYLEGVNHPIQNDSL